MSGLVLSDIKNFEAIAQLGTDVVSLAQGALRIGGVDQAIKNYVKEILDTDLADYYSPGLGLPELRAVLAQQLSEQGQCSVSVRNVMISHGSMGGIVTVLRAVLSPGDHVLLPDPTYVSYYNLIHVAHAQPISVPAFVNSESGWIFDIEVIKKSITAQTRAILIANPSNPLGICLTKVQMIELAELAQFHGIYLIIDEVYENYIFEGEFCSATSYAVTNPFVIRAGSFSKNFGMSGWRVGYVIASEDIINLCVPIQDIYLGNPVAIAQYAALYALKNPQLLVQAHNAVKQCRAITLAALEPLNERGILKFEKPASGLYIFAKTKENDATELAREILHLAHVAVVPGRGFSPRTSGYLRICFARDPQVLALGLARLTKFFKQPVDIETILLSAQKFEQKLVQEFAVQQESR